MTITAERPVSAVSEGSTGRRRRLRSPWAVAVGAVVGLLALVLAIGGGGQGGEQAGSNAGTAGTAAGAPLRSLPAPVEADGQAAGQAAKAAGAAGAASAPEVPADIGSKVVKTGEVALEVDEGRVPTTLDRLIAIATVQRGYVADSHSTAGSVPTGSVTLRVPVAAFEATVTAVRSLPGTVGSQQTAGQDVTGKYVDLQARIRALAATRSSFERLLTRAGTIGDTLAVQSRITDVQTQIEQLQGELRVLTDQSSFGTLTVTVAERGARPVAAHHESGMIAAWDRSVRRFTHGVEAVVGLLGPLAFVALLAAAGWLVWRLGYRRLRRQLL
jgi:hypothetical protein